MRIRAEDLKKLAVLTLISAPAIAFMTFDFVFPNVTTLSLEKNLLVAFLLSTLFGMPAGYMTKRIDMAVLTVLAYVTVGYSLAITAYSAPFIFYNFSVMFPDLYVLFFLNMTVIPVMLFVLGGIVGVMLGQVLQESYEREETAQVFSRIRR